jgi:hypothetical protein
MSVLLSRNLLTLALIAALPAGFLCGQEASAPSSVPATAAAAPPAPVDAALLQKKTGEWIETRRLIGEEASAWQTEKNSLAELNAIRAKETTQLDAFVQAATVRIGELTNRKGALAKEQTDLKAWRAKLEADLSALEAGLRPLLPRFPAPLREKIQESLVRIESPEADQPLQNRARDLLLVLQACLEFQNTLTLHNEVREIGGERREVEVLYLGMTQAWYVDAAGRHSGHGVPGEQGWIWSEDPAIASRVRSAIEIQARRATPAFVELPLSNAVAGKEGSK